MLKMTNKKAAKKAAKTNAQRQSEFRARKNEIGLKEVRGIFASDANAVKIREYAQTLQ